MCRLRICLPRALGNMQLTGRPFQAILANRILQRGCSSFFLSVTTLTILAVIAATTSLTGNRLDSPSKKSMCISVLRYV